MSSQHYGYLTNYICHIATGTEPTVERPRQPHDASSGTVSSNTTVGEGSTGVDVNPPQGTREYMVWVVTGASLLTACGLGAMSLAACVLIYKDRTRRPDSGTAAVEGGCIATPHESVYMAPMGTEKEAPTQRCLEEHECSCAGSAGRTRESIVVTANVCFDISIPI